MYVCSYIHVIHSIYLGLGARAGRLGLVGARADAVLAAEVREERP